MGQATGGLLLILLAVLGFIFGGGRHKAGGRAFGVALAIAAGLVLAYTRSGAGVG